MGAAMTVLDRVSRSNIIKIVLTLVVYAFYACVLGASLAPSALVVLWAFHRFLSSAILASAVPAVGPIILFCLSCGASAYVFFFFGLLLMGCVIRLFSLGIQPGTHNAASLTVLLWIVLSGVWTLAFRLILPLVPMTPLSMMFHRLSGCRIGKNVWINTNSLIDCYMISIGDNTIIGGEAVLSPHVYENGSFLIRRITIGKNCLIGGHSYISPGVTIGDGSVIGMKTYVRKGRQIPPGTHMTTVAGIPIARAVALEKGTFRKLQETIKNQGAGRPRKEKV
jgi:carbonic anhydrase/acetyltransferase-like protein (isoleucine patch superfamily)